MLQTKPGPHFSVFSVPLRLCVTTRVEMNLAQRHGRTEVRK